MIISLQNRKGGVGKTTLAVHIAYALATKGVRVLLVLDAGVEVLNNLFTFLKEEGIFLLTIREDYRQQMQTALGKLPWQLVSEESFPIYDEAKLMYLLAFKKERSL